YAQLYQRRPQNRPLPMERCGWFLPSQDFEPLTARRKGHRVVLAADFAVRHHKVGSHQRLQTVERIAWSVREDKDVRLAAAEIVAVHCSEVTKQLLGFVLQPNNVVETT